MDVNSVVYNVYLDPGQFRTIEILSYNVWNITMLLVTSALLAGGVLCFKFFSK